MKEAAGNENVQQRDKRTDFLDGMRGYAAITVVMAHTLYFTHYDWGIFAVDIFFCLSSFLLTMLFYGVAVNFLKAQRSLRDWGLMLGTYFLKRFVRVYPLFAVVVFFEYFIPEDRLEWELHGTKFNLFRVLIFDPELRYSVYWSLPVEIAYYFVLPLFTTFIALSGKYWWLANLAAGIWAYNDSSSVQRLRWGTPISSLHVHLSTFTMASVFAIFYCHIKQYMERFSTTVLRSSVAKFIANLISSAMFFLIGLALTYRANFLLGIMSNPEPKNFPHTSLPILTIIVCELLYPSWIADIFASKILRFFGKISYPLYLIHRFPIKVWPCSFCSDTLDVTIYTMVYSVGVSSLIHYYFEIPLMSRAKKIYRWLASKESGMPISYIPLSQVPDKINYMDLIKKTKIMTALFLITMGYTWANFSYRTFYSLDCQVAGEWQYGNCTRNEDGTYTSVKTKKVLHWETDFGKCDASEYFQKNSCQDCEFSLTTDDFCDGDKLWTKVAVKTPSQGLGSLPCPADTHTDCPEKMSIKKDDALPEHGCLYSDWVPGHCSYHDGIYSAVDSRVILQPSSDGSQCGDLIRKTMCSDCKYNVVLDQSCDGGFVTMRVDVVSVNVGLGSTSCPEAVAFKCPTTVFERKQVEHQVFLIQNPDVLKQQSKQSLQFEKMGKQYRSSHLLFLQDKEIVPLLPPEFRSRLVFSISTFPARSEFLWQSVQSLLNQTRVPDLIYIHMPEDIARISQNETQAAENIKSLQDWIDSHPQKDKIYWNLGCVDYGPPTKLIGGVLLENDNDTLIMIGDDDVVYGKFTVEIAERNYYDRLSKGHVNSIANYCEKCLTDNSIELTLEGITGGECTGYQFGVGGVIYKREWFVHEGPQLWDFSGAPDGCKLHDDVYLTGTLWKWTGIRPYVVESVSYLYHHSYNTYSIARAAGNHPKRDECIRYFDYFGSHPKITTIA